MTPFVISKLTRCRLLAILSGPSMALVSLLPISFLASATQPLVATSDLWIFRDLQFGMTWLLATLLTYGLAVILGPYDLLVILSWVVVALLSFGANYAMNVSSYLPNDGHTFFDIAGGVPPFYFWGHFWILSCLLGWALATAIGGIALKRWLVRAKTGTVPITLPRAERRGLWRGLILDTTLLFFLTAALLVVDVVHQMRLGRPDVMIANAAKVLDSPMSSGGERSVAISDLQRYSDKFRPEDIQDAIVVLRHAMQVQPDPLNLESAAALLGFNDLSGLPLIENSLMHATPGGSTFLASCLRGIKDPAALPTLVRLMNSPDPETRRSAAIGLRNMRSRDIIEPLLKGLDDTDYEVRRDSAHGLIMFLDQHRSEYHWKLVQYERPKDGEEINQIYQSALKAWAKARFPKAASP